MASLLPLSSYNLVLQPFSPEPCQSDDFPITVRLTLAAIDPEAVDDKKEPATLRMLKKTNFFDDGEDSDSEDDEDDDEDEDDDDDDDDEDKKEKKEKKEKKSSKTSNDDEGEDDEDSDIEDDEGIEEHIICTLSPESQFQQTLDLTILPDEEVYFVVTGSYTVHLTGNYVEHPNDEDEDDFVYGSDGEEDYDDEEYDLTPDEDEIIDEIDYDLDELDNIENIEGKIEELIEEEAKQNEKKRQVEESSEPEPKKSKKESKKEKKEKTVKFNKELEQGPTGPAATKESKKEAKKDSKKEAKKDSEKKETKKPTIKTLPGGVVIEDKTIGTGPVCRKGQKVGVRYIGKLKNGKVFDKNTSGKPFNFGLGKGEVIKGWDVGVAGMSVGGERRIVIPASMAYGSQKLPGIPANSELTFDVKLLSMK